MKKRRLIIGDYDTAEDGRFTLSACKITKGSQVQSFVSVPGRYAPIDTSTLLTDGQPYYGSAALDATLESSEGTRDERLARVSGMVNALDGRSMRIIHPDHPERYLVGRVQVRPEYNDPAHCAVRVSAVCEPWLYNAQETEVQANLPHAEIHKIGGVTRKCTNLIPYPYTFAASVEVNGITYTANSDGSITLNGTATKTSVIVVSNAIKVKDGTYTVGKISPDTGVFAQLFYKASDGSYPTWNVYNDPVTLDMSAGITYSFQLAVSAGVTVSNVKVYPMLNEGSTALPYEPYFDGLRSAPVTEVESVGANLFDGETLKGYYSGGSGEYVYYEAESCSKNYISILPNTQYCVTGAQNYVLFYDSNKNFVSSKFYNAQPFATPTNARYMRINFGNADTSKIAVNEGSTALPYRPYTRNTLPIPEAVQALDGYGEGVNESVYNYIDFETKQFVKRVGKVDLGMIDWLYNGYANDGTTTIMYSRLLSMQNLSPVLCSAFEQAERTQWENLTIGEIMSEHDNYIVVATNYTDVATFKAAMSGVMLYYKLATPEITDISDLLPGVNTIPAEAGGTLTMVNPYGYEVPHEVTYNLDGESPQQVELTNAGRLAVVPVVTVKGEVTLSYGNITQTLSTGTYTLPWLYLTPDKGPLLPASHIVTCSGGGSVTFTYREAVLAE